MGATTRLPVGIFLPPISTSASRCDAHRPLYRAVVAQQLFDRALDQRRVVLQHSELVGMTQEGEKAVTDEVCARLMAGDEEQHARSEEFLFAKLVAPLFGRDQQVEEIRTGPPPALRKEATEILGQRAASRSALFHDVSIRRKAKCVEAPSDIRGPLPNNALIPGRHAECLADHRDWKWIGQIGDDVHHMRALDSIQESIDNLLNVLAHALHRMGCEGLADQAPQARVRGWIPEDHWPVHLFPSGPSL
jgi:hypothetical protein